MVIEHVNLRVNSLLKHYNKIFDKVCRKAGGSIKHGRPDNKTQFYIFMLSRCHHTPLVLYRTFSGCLIIYLLCHITIMTSQIIDDYY